MTAIVTEWRSISPGELAVDLQQVGMFGVWPVESQGLDQALEGFGAVVALWQPYETATILADEQECILLECAVGRWGVDGSHRGVTDLGSSEAAAAAQPIVHLDCIAIDHDLRYSRAQEVADRKEHDTANNEPSKDRVT